MIAKSCEEVVNSSLQVSFHRIRVVLKTRAVALVTMPKPKRKEEEVDSDSEPDLPNVAAKKPKTDAANVRAAGYVRLRGSLGLELLRHGVLISRYSVHSVYHSLVSIAFAAVRRLSQSRRSTLRYAPTHRRSHAR